MVKAKEKQLNHILIGHLNTIHETFQLLGEKPASSLEKVSWNEVLQMGEQVYKQATIIGMLWTGQAPEAKAIAETMESFTNMLQGFLLLCHGSTVGAGPTLSSSVHASVKQLVDCSFKLLQGSVSLYENSYDQAKKPLIPQLVGAVWEACSVLKKNPTTNTVAIGRAVTKVAVSMKDVLREMKELKPALSSSTVEASINEPEGSSLDVEDSSDNDDDDNDMGNDLSHEEMEVAELVTCVVSETLLAIKELIRTISGLIKLEKPSDCSDFVDSLEKLLKLCEGIGVQVDELGACVYPPQEFSTMKKTLEKLSKDIDEVQVEVEKFESSSESFVQACNGLRSSIKQTLHHLAQAEVVIDMHKVALCN